jgi:2-keto-3-deoxy-6-phosphogluconate aldolase
LISDALPLIPVLHVDHTEPLAEAPVDASITVLEATLRSASGPFVIERMHAQTHTVCVNWRSHRDPGGATRAHPRCRRAIRVSPALTPALAEAAHESGLPYVQVRQCRPKRCAPTNLAL